MINTCLQKGTTQIKVLVKYKKKNTEMKKLYFTILFLLFLGATFAQNNKPVAVNDTVYTFCGDSVYINPLANDYDPDGDIIKMSGTIFGFEKINDTLWRNIVPIENFKKGFYSDTLFYQYSIYDGDLFNRANIILILAKSLDYAFSDANNINALISPIGNHFWDFEYPKSEVPKGSGKTAVFNSTLWMSGLTKEGQLCTAAERYRQNGADFYHGPISLQEDSAEIAKWLPGTWKLNLQEIEYHKNNWDKNGYVPNQVINEWPANGNPSNGQMEIYAPFYDRNNNRKYEPLQGDYPEIRGDQSVFFIMNDSMRIHLESIGRKMGIEVLGMAYEFNRPDNPVLNNTLFLHYDIVNRSQKDYLDVYLGIFSDFDIGEAFDDYFGTDVSHGMVYAYNGLPVDGTGQSFAYGNKPPAIGMKIIAGPYLPADGTDNPTGQCEYSINGLGFGDAIVDNERMGMTNSMYFSNTDINPACTDPHQALFYYTYMRSHYKDNTPLQYGITGHISSGALGPDCNYYMPGYTDTVCNWGTGGVIPNGGYNQNGFFWNEETNHNTPGDRRGLGSIGPFTLRAGESFPLDFCYVFVQSEDGAIASRDSLIKAVGYIQNIQQDIIAFEDVPYGKRKVPELSSLKVFPNPASTWAAFDYRLPDFESAGLLEITDITGHTILSIELHDAQGQYLLDTRPLNSGMYLYSLTSGKARKTGKFAVVK